MYQLLQRTSPLISTEPISKLRVNRVGSAGAADGAAKWRVHTRSCLCPPFRRGLASKMAGRACLRATHRQAATRSFEIGSMILFFLLLTMHPALNADVNVLLTPYNAETMKSSPGNKQYLITGSSAPGFLFFSSEDVNLNLKFSRGEDHQKQNYTLEIQGVNTHKPNKSREFIDPYGYPDIIKLDGNPVRHQFTVDFADQKEAEFELKNLPIPDKLGTYCLVLTKGDQRFLLGSVARVMKPRQDGNVDNTPVFGEGAIFSGFNDKGEAAKCYYRMGIRGIRCEIGWRGNKEDGSYDWTEYDNLTAALRAGRMQAMFTLGSVNPKYYDIPVDVNGIPAAVVPGWDGNPYGGQADWGCGLKHFDTYQEWVRLFCKRYWQDGKGALWGLENYNEPWEGGGISGYARDCISYREWQRRMARAARSVSENIKICAASSIMNTEDKFYSEGPGENGKYEMDEYLDVFTDHYVTPYNAYGPMVAAKHGKVSIENETWLVISEYLLPQVMCQWMACGQLAVMPFHPNVLFESLDGSPQKFFMPSTVPVATAAFNHFVTGLRFEKIVFKDHLPWLFQFGKDSDPAGVSVMIGQLLTRGGPTPQDNPEGRLWRQVDSVDGGSITIDNSDGALQFFDVAGNEIYKSRKSVVIPLDLSATYIKSSKGPALVAERISNARIEGKYPAEIIPRDFSTAISDKNLSLSVAVANRINRPISGTLSLKAPEGFDIKNNNQKVSLNAGESKQLEFSFNSVKEDPANSYPFEFSLESDAGKCAYSETLHCNIAPKMTKIVDGNLADWNDVPGITVAGKSDGVNPDELARKPWLRIKDEAPKSAIFAKIRMAWDENFIYIAAEVNDTTPQTDKIRMEKRKDASYFHSADSDSQEPWKSWLAKHAPGHSFAKVPYIYKKKPFDNSYSGDQLQLGFNVRDDWHDLKPLTDVPKGFHAYPDTDYEFSAYLCEDGKSELWNLLTPDMPRIHGWPNQPMGKIKHNPTPGSKHAVKQNGNLRTYEIAIPKSAIPELNLKTGSKFKFTFFIGNNDGPKITYGEKKAVTKSNGLTLHPYWENKPSCEIEWTLVD